MYKAELAFLEGTRVAPEELLFMGIIFSLKVSRLTQHFKFKSQKYHSGDKYCELMIHNLLDYDDNYIFGCQKVS